MVSYMVAVASVAINHESVIMSMVRYSLAFWNSIGTKVMTNCKKR